MISDNKIMSNHKRELIHNRIKSYHFDKLQEPIRVQIDRKYANPQTLAHHKYQYMPSQHRPQKLQEYIKSPLQKDQFLSRPANNTNKTCPSAVQTLSSESVKSKTSPDRSMSKSYSSYQIRENFTYLQQVIMDMAQKNDLTSTRKYVNRIGGELALKCDKIINRIQDGYLTARKQVDKYQQGMIKLYKLCNPKTETVNLPRQKMFKDIEQSIVKLQHQSQRGDERQKAKEWRDELRVMSSRIEAESTGLQASFEKEKREMKQHYQDIYRRIYEENMKLKRQAQVVHKQLEQQKKEQNGFQHKYQGVFKDISSQLTELKDRCKDLKEDNNRQKRIADSLKQLLSQKEEVISKLKVEKDQKQHLALQMQKFQKQAGSRAERFQSEIIVLSREVEALKTQISMQKTLNSLLQQKMQMQSRKNSTNTLLFQLSAKSAEESQSQTIKLELEEQRQQLEEQKGQLSEVMRRLTIASEQFRKLLGRKEKVEQELNSQEQLLKTVQTTVRNKTVELDGIRGCLVQQEVQLASISQQQREKQGAIKQLQRQLQQSELLLLQSKGQCERLSVRRKQAEQEIGRLILSLVRLQSDELMIEQKMGAVDWVGEWWKWIKETNHFDLS